MDHRSRFSSLSASYDNFLYAPVCEDANGMRLSVISALARSDVDPWEEATRLAAMPRAIAEKTLLSILDLVSGRSWKSPEAAAVAARLIRLLPQQGEAAPVAATGAANVPALRKSYWWVWLGFALALSFMTPHHQAPTANTDAAISQASATTNTGDATSQAGATANLKGNSPDPVGLSR